MKSLAIGYKPAFIRQLKKLPLDLQNEAKKRIALFAIDPTHASLHTHKLKGSLKGRWSFSVNFNYRIVFIREGRNITLLMIGDHKVYD